MLGRDHGVRESALRREQPARSEDLGEELQGNLERSHQTDETKDDAEARNEFWSVEGDFIYCHHVEPRVQLNVPKDETFPIPLKYIDVTRTAHTNLDMLQESRIDDFWNVEVDGNLSDSRTGFTKFTLVNEKPLEGCGTGDGLQRFMQLPDLIMCGLRFGPACRQQLRKKEKQEWAIEKPKIDDSRRLIGNYFIDPEDGEYKETIKNSRKKLEIPMEAAMPCEMGAT